MSWITRELGRRGAHRIDLNCGCPAKRVTKRGAGSSLLREPSVLFHVVRTMVESGHGSLRPPITVKMRSGFDNVDLFLDNVRAVEEAGAAAITIHPRTKAQHYLGSADWSLIQKAKTITSVPIVGNGDITTVELAVEMLETTGCDALMIGRGAVRNPWLFHEVRARLRGQPTPPRTLHDIQLFWTSYLEAGRRQGTNAAANIGRMKMIAKYYFDQCPWLQQQRHQILRTHHTEEELFLEHILQILYKHHSQCTNCTKPPSTTYSPSSMMYYN